MRAIAKWILLLLTCVLAALHTLYTGVWPVKRWLERLADRLVDIAERRGWD